MTETKKQSVGQQIGGTLGCLLFLAIMFGFGFMIWATNTNFFPPDYPLKGEKLSERAMKKITSVVDLQPDEEIVVYAGGHSFKYDHTAHILTNQRVITYYPGDGETVVNYFPYENIERVDYESTPNSDDIWITLHLSGGQTYELWAYAYRNMASSFYTFIRTRAKDWEGDPSPMN